MSYREDEIAASDWAVTVGSEENASGGVVISVDEEIGTTNRIAGVAMRPEQARALAELLLKHANRAEGKAP